MESESLNARQARLSAAYPHWRFWRAERGKGALMATRRENITDAQIDDGLARTLPIGVGGDIDLEHQLEEQTRIEHSLGGDPAPAPAT